MKAMILAAGIGSRLGNLTIDTPKCLIEIGGRTMLDYVVENLKATGVTEIVINLHHQSEKIREHIKAQKSYGISVEFSNEEKLLDTGGGVKKVAKFFEGEPEFIVHNSDVYSDLKIRKLVDFHKHRSALATLWVMERKTSRPLMFDKELNLVGWEIGNGTKELIGNHSVDTKLAFSGVQVLSPNIFQFMEEEEGSFSIIRAYINAVKSGEKVLGFKDNASYWMDMGTPKGLDELKRHLVK